jgi:serine protease Do
MAYKVLQGSKRPGWLAGAVAGAGLVLTTLFIQYSPDAQSQSAAEPKFGVVSFADVVEDVSPAVVNIAVTKVERAMPTTGFDTRQLPRGQVPEQFEQFPFEFFERFFDMPGAPQPRERRSEGQGSGFVIDAEGHIVTNNHVIESADKITVTLQDGRKLDATLVGSDAKTDLALIKVNSSNLPYVEFGDSDRARVGEWVVAIGNPFGLGGTATAGIISARGRDIQSGPYDDYLQLDAPINFGNSGGPVFDASGHVVGVSTAIFSPNGGNVGIAFAIPANQAKAVIGEIKESGSVERGWLGVQIQDLDADLAASLGLDSENGALVAEVLGDGPARAAGVQAGDVITRFDDHEIDSARTLSRVVGDADPSDTANLTVWRDGKSQQLRVKLGEAARSEQVAARPAPGVNGETMLGLTLRGLTDQDKAQLGLSNDTRGVLVANVEPNSPAAEKGIRAGDVITRVNQRDVDSVDEALDALADARDENLARLLVKRGDGQRFVALSFS